jgi:hypothetical protein
MMNEALDKLTRELFEPEECEDPFCCTIIRRKIINKIRAEAGLELLEKTKAWDKVLKPTFRESIPVKK